jgi:hypothetical protein
MSSRKTNNAGLVLLAATTLVVAACGGGSDGYMPEPPPPVNSAPVISGIADFTGNQDTVVGPIEFSVTDTETPASQLTVIAGAGGTSVFPVDGLTLAGSRAVRSITLTPFEATTGTANITLTVIDGEGVRTARSFQVTVNARNASIRDWTLTTFAKAESDEVTAMNGYTFTQDADDPAIFQPLIGGDE